MSGVICDRWKGFKKGFMNVVREVVGVKEEDRRGYRDRLS